MKKELIKNGFIIGIIILLACFVTFKIYNKFHGERSVDYSSKSLDVVFHENTGDKIILDKATPLTDNLGLATKSYTFTITNNLTEEVPITIKLVNDEEAINDMKCDQGKCDEVLIPKKDLKVSIKENNGKNQVFALEELKDDVLLDTNIDALEENTYTIRVWVKDDVELDSNLKYYGKIQVVEDNNILARR